MFSIFTKEISAFFSTLIGYLVIGVFLVAIGLFMWVFSDTSVLSYNFATMEQLFSIAPLVFLFLIPAITMRSFAEEMSSGTLELLFTKPLTINDIVLAKYLSNLTLVILALIPTSVYYVSIYMLGSPVGNIDTGAVIGSYIGLFFLGGSFVAIGMFASALSRNQIIAFILGAFLCFFVHWAFSYIANIRTFSGGLDLFIQKLGINYHYSSISKGLIDSKDIIYFLSVIFLFLYGTVLLLKTKR